MDTVTVVRVANVLYLDTGWHSRVRTLALLRVHLWPFVVCTCTYFKHSLKSHLKGCWLQYGISQLIQ